MNQLKTSTWALLVSALVLLAVLVTAPLGYRLELVPLLPSLASLPLAAAGGLLVIAAGAFYLVSAIRHGLAGDRNLVLVSMVLAALPVFVVVPQIAASRSVPPIHDITTDTANPPVFVALLEERTQAPNGAGYGKSEQWPPEKLAAAQAAAYPHIKPVMSSLDRDAAVVRAEQVLHDMGLDLVWVDRDTGLLEATAMTFWFGFIDDVVVRVTGEGEGSRLDLRSMSRVGQSDLGANAARIEEFVRRFNSG